MLCAILTFLKIIGDHMDSSKQMGISQLLRQVQQELVTSEQERRQAGISSLFELDGCEVEVKFVVKQEEKAGGKIDLKLFAVGIDDSYSSEQTHSVKLNFKITSDKDTDLKMLDQKPVGKRPRNE